MLFSMPRFTVVCDDGHEQEFVGKVFTIPDIYCPRIVKGKRCGKKVRRKFNPPWIKFSGNGFYKTDNKK